MDVTSIAIKADTSELNSATKDLDDFKKSADDAAKSADKVGGESKGATEGVASVGRAASAAATEMSVAAEAGMLLGSAASVAAAGATAAAAAWVAWQGVQVVAALSIKDTAEELNKMSERLGVGVEKLSELRYSAAMADVSQGEMTQSIRVLTNKMQEAAKGTGAAAAAFDTMGLSVKNADGTLKNVDVMLSDIADKFKSYENGAAKGALANDLLGRSGMNLISMLNQGADGLRANAQEARMLGVVYTEETAKAGEELNDNLKRIGFALEGVKIALGSDMLKALADFSSKVMEARAATGGFVEGLLAMAGKNPFGSWQERTADLRSEIQGLEKDRARILGQHKGADVSAIDTSIKALTGRLTYARQQYSEELAKTNAATYSNEGHGREIAKKAAPDPAIEAKIRNLEEQARKLGKTKSELIEMDIKSSNLTAEQAARYREAALAVDKFNDAKKGGKGGSRVDQDQNFLDSMRQKMQANDAGISASSQKELDRIDELRDKRKIQYEEWLEMISFVYNNDSVYKARQKEMMQEELRDMDKKIKRQGELDKMQARVDETIGKQALKNAALIQDEQDMLTYMHETNEAHERRVKLLEIEREAEKAILEIRKEYESKGMQGTDDEAKAIAAVRRNAEETAKIWGETYDTISAYRKTSEHGAAEAIKKYREEIDSSSGLMESAMTKSFKGMEDALVAFATKGKFDFKSLADSIIADLVRITIQQSIMKPLMGGSMPSFGGIGGLFGFGGGTQSAAPVVDSIPTVLSANGNIFNNASGLHAYANSVVTQPTLFQFAKGAGLMGEAGPEAIIPLQRGNDGKLGIQGGVSTIVVNVKSTSGNTAEIKRSAAEGARSALNLMSGAKRYG